MSTKQQTYHLLPSYAIIQLTTSGSHAFTKVLHWPVFLQLIYKLVEAKGICFYLSLYCIKKLHYLLCRHLQRTNHLSRITWQQISGVKSARQWYGVLNTVIKIRKVFFERKVLCALAVLKTVRYTGFIKATIRVHVLLALIITLSSKHAISNAAEGYVSLRLEYFRFQG